MEKPKALKISKQMTRKIFHSLLLSFIIFHVASGIDAGIARRVITPDSPVWLSGYASRKKPSEGKLHDLWAKALVLKDNDEIQLVLVTLDIIGLPHELSESISLQLMSDHAIPRSRILLNTSHTHSGPVIWPSLSIMYDLDNNQLKALIDYRQKLAENIIDIVREAAGDAQPVKLYAASGTAGFAVNRRQPTEKGVIIGINPEGNVDKSIPVIKIESPEGKLRAVIFGYACHNTTLDGYEINGDYAGFAQLEIENANTGVTAMFLAGCGADQNPNPRRSIENAIAHGKALAGEVQEVLEGSFKPVRTTVKTGFEIISLAFSPVDKKQYETDLSGTNIHRSRRAAAILTAIDKGYDVSFLSYPVQAVRFGSDLTIVALAGEVVVDYSLKTKERYPDENLFVAGYSNEVQCYIPTRKILEEGGYEAETSMVYYGLPGPLDPDVEDRITAAIDRVMKTAGAKKH
jgi:hypothetical protein